MTSTKMTEPEYQKSADEMIDAIRTRADLVKALEYLLWGYRQGFYYREQSLEDFLERVIDYTESMDQIYRNWGEECPTEADWSRVADIFQSGFEDV